MCVCADVYSNNIKHVVCATHTGYTYWLSCSARTVQTSVSLSSVLLSSGLQISEEQLPTLTTRT